MRSLAENLASMATVSDHDVEVTPIEREKRAIGQYQCERYNNMLNGIETKMDFHKVDLLAKWRNQKELLDYQALKEFRSEMESTHKKLCYMASEWERRKLSDRLSDHLMDVIGRKHDEYMLEYRRMDELKRTEAAVQRKRHLELEEYKSEKRRALPTWPNSFPYLHGGCTERGDLSSPGNLLMKNIICDTNNLPTVILTLVQKMVFTSAPI